MIAVLPDEEIFFDYLDDSYRGEGFKLIDTAPEEAVRALASWQARYDELIEQGIDP